MQPTPNPEPEKKPAKVWPKGEMPVRIAGRRGGKRPYKRHQGPQQAEAAQQPEKGAE